jgi:pimeloyl-[acyl-carrier protein] methyl ester esterase
MTRPIEIIAHHGWGFTSSCWDCWQPLLTNGPISLTASNRGYFSAANAPDFTHNSFHVLMVHSYGLHWCPIATFQRVDLLVIFNSFIDFHPHDPRDRRRSQRIVQQMIQECQRDPITVLTMFYQRCGYIAPQELDFNQLDSDRLVADLQHLNTVSVDLDALKGSPPVLLFHGLADQIVPELKGQELFEQLKDKANYFTFPDAGHALPFTHCQPCWVLINDWILQHD